MHKQVKLILASLALFVLLPFTTFAADYGYGTFGEGDYSRGSYQPSNSSTIQGSTTNTPACNDQSPGTKSPWLYGAIAKDGNTIELYFTEADNPVNKYVLEYGTGPGQYQYGISDMGVNERHQMTFMVKLLKPETTYYFHVRGGNGCAVGPWSNELSATTKDIVAFNQLNMSSTVTTGKSTPQEQASPPDEKTTEKSNDTEETTIEGYNVRVKVVDTAKKAVKGASVTLHSTPRKAITDTEGIALFSNVEPGDHKVLIAYQNFEGEQSLNVSGEIKEISLNITIEPKNVVFNTVSVSIIALLSVIVAGLVTWIAVLRRKKG